MLEKSFYPASSNQHLQYRVSSIRYPIVSSISSERKMPGRILVIEDNPQNLELMSYLLRAFGHVVVSASDGAEGLDLVGREMFDVIICDVHLPKFDGYEVVRRLKKDSVLRRIPVVAVTALAMVGDRDKVLAAGFDGYIDKPIAPEMFVKQVEAFMHKKS